MHKTGIEVSKLTTDELMFSSVLSVSMIGDTELIAGRRFNEMRKRAIMMIAVFVFFKGLVAPIFDCFYSMLL